MSFPYTYPLSQTVNSQVACDQMKLEISSSSISAQLMDGPMGIEVLFTAVTIRFESELSSSDQDALSEIVSNHTGAGLPSPNEFQSLDASDLPSNASAGDSFYATTGLAGAGPVYWDGSQWLYYATNSSVE